MTRVLWKKIYADASDKCVLCRGGEEDCKHLYFSHNIGHQGYNISGCYQ